MRAKKKVYSVPYLSILKTWWVKIAELQLLPKDRMKYAGAQCRWISALTNVIKFAKNTACVTVGNRFGRSRVSNRPVNLDRSIFGMPIPHVAGVDEKRTALRYLTVCFVNVAENVQLRTDFFHRSQQVFAAHRQPS